MTQAERTELSVRVQVLLSTGPAIHDEETAWNYVREMIAAIRAGREGIENLLVIEQLSELWRLNHQRKRVATKTEQIFARIGRDLKFKAERFAAFVASQKAGRAV
jgi:hypothetical protein